MTKITVEVAYASQDEQFLRACLVEPSSTILSVIQASGVLTAFPVLTPEDMTVGIFSEKKKLQDGVKQGDRVEIYRPLTIDPKTARRLRAENQHKK